MSDCCHPKSDSCSSSVQPDWMLRGLLVLVGLSCLSVALWGQTMPTWLHTFTHTQLEFMQKAWVGLMLGIVSVGVLSQIPRQWVNALLGDGHSVLGIIRAALAGLLLDTCSHGVLMVGMKLYERGASYGQVVAFLLATPWNSLSLTLILWSLIGLKLTIIFVVSSFAIGVLSGIICNGLEKSGILTLPKLEINSEDAMEQASVGQVINRLKNVPEWLWQGALDARMVLRWVMLGAVLSGMIRVLMPPEAFGAWFGPTFSGLGLTLVAATVIEICSEGSVPIAADLVTRAAAPGNGFTFLMAGVSTDVTELLAVRDTTKSTWAALWIPVVTVPQVLLVAWVINHNGVM